VLRTPARLALAFVLTLSCAACGGNPEAKPKGVEAFPDVLEIARSELGEDAVLRTITVDENAISFVHVQFGRTTRITYDAQGVFTGSKRLPNPPNLRAIFPISEVAADAPERLLTEVRKKDGNAVKDFTATLGVNARGALAWHAKAVVDGTNHDYTASADGTLRG
jgi:hypothetical protein